MTTMVSVRNSNGSFTSTMRESEVRSQTSMKEREESVMDEDRKRSITPRADNRTDLTGPNLNGDDKKIEATMSSQSPARIPDFQKKSPKKDRQKSPRPRKSPRRKKKQHRERVVDDEKKESLKQKPSPVKVVTPPKSPRSLRMVYVSDPSMVSRAGNPLVPILMESVVGVEGTQPHEQQPLMYRHHGHPNQQQYHHSPKRSPKVYSYGTLEGDGSEDEVVMILPPAPTLMAVEDPSFCPGKELRQMAAQLSHSRRSLAESPGKPGAAVRKKDRHKRSFSSNDANLLYTASPKASHMMAKGHARSASHMVVMSETLSPKQATTRHARSNSWGDSALFYTASPRAADVNPASKSVSFSPRIPSLRGVPSVNSVPSRNARKSFHPLLRDTSDESLNIPSTVKEMSAASHTSPPSTPKSLKSKSSNSIHPPTPSSFRRRHMRQHSIQLFMSPTRGKPQPTRFRDTFFLLLFYLQIGFMIYMGVKYGHQGIANNVWEQPNQTDNIKVNYLNILQVTTICGLFAWFLSGFALLFMMVFSRNLIQIVLIFSIGLSFVWGTVGIGFYPTSFVPVGGIIALMLSVGYAFVVWERIPFAAANVHTALCGIRSNVGVLFVAYFFQVVAFVWCVWWFYASLGVYDAVFNDCEECEDSMKIRRIVFLGLGISYYWTFQVILHIVQVIVVGAIGSWWSDANHNSLAVVRQSFIKSQLFSFGSICFGSLFVGFIQITRQLVESFRPQRSENVLLCLQESLLFFAGIFHACFDNLVDHFNPWAFTYIGLYWYPFLEAGHNATTLFQKRGWAKISSDDLINNVLMLFSLVIAGCTGFFGFVIEEYYEDPFTSLHHPVSTAFIIGFLIGLVISHVLLGTVSSAVNTIIVCFASAPEEFSVQHPDLSQEMRSAWKEVWPGSLVYPHSPHHGAIV